MSNVPVVAFHRGGARVWTVRNRPGTLHRLLGNLNPQTVYEMQNTNLPVECDVRSVKAMLDEGANEVLLLDCREPEEYEFARLSGARHIPMGEISGRLTELSGCENKPIIVYCHHGGRSLMVTQFLRQQGFNGAQSMSGGIDAWAVEIEPGLPRY